jgi:serine protease
MYTSFYEVKGYKLQKTTVLLKSTTFSFVIAALLLLAWPLMPLRPAAAQSNQSAKAEKFYKNSVIFKLSAGANVQYDGANYVGTPQYEVAQLNKILNNAKKVKAEKLVNNTSAGKGELQAQFNKELGRYYKARFAKDVDVAAITEQLSALSIIELAHPEPTPVPPPSDDYKSLQTDLQAAPTGINANYASTFPGGIGTAATIFDVEYSWNTAHEDLSTVRATGARLNYGTPIDPFNDINHGTAVIGDIGADNNTFGVSGAAYGAPIRLVNVYSQEYGYDLSGALGVVAQNAQKGDVVLIEQQSWGLDGSDSYLPVEWIPEVYDAIKALTTNGVIVVEPAANGNVNLDDSVYGVTFPIDKADSGAIMVGAGLNCSAGPRLSRASFSNYGRRVDVQGPGECVYTTGYGDVGSPTPNLAYTANFGGTSSASSVVASATASLSSAYETLNAGANLTPAQVRSILISTGTAQDNTTGTLTGYIGPMPNLAKALLQTDITAPTLPGKFNATLINPKKKPYLTWTASTDKVNVAGYQIYRNNVLYKTVTGLNYTDTSVAMKNTYTYKVRSYDTSGNYSAFTAAKSVLVK